MTPDIREGDDGESSVEVVIDRTTASEHHPSTAVLTADTLGKIGVQTGEVVQLSTSNGDHAYAVAETGESTGLDVSTGELLTDIPVFSALVCGVGERISVSGVTLPEANQFTVVPVDTTTTSILKQCSVTSAKLVDAVAHDGGIVEFRPTDVGTADTAVPYYARIETVSPDTPARVTENTRVDIREPDIPELPEGVLSAAERPELYTTDLCSKPADTELRTRLRERLEASLKDLQLLAKQLPDEDIQQVFDAGSDELSPTTTAATDVVALCWLGFNLASDAPTWRVEQAIQRALYANDEDGEVDLRVTRQALSPAADSLDRFCQHGLDTSDTYGTIERLWTDPDVDPFELYDVTRTQLGEEFALPPAELLIERLAYRVQARRFPMAQVMDVSVEEGKGGSNMGL
jgi:hypothetical protein